MQNKTRQEGILCHSGTSRRQRRSASQRLFERVKQFLRAAHAIFAFLVIVFFLSLADSGSMPVTLLGALGLGLIFWRLGNAFPVNENETEDDNNGY